MSVWHEKSDLFKSDAGIIAHGCNCRSVMGAGVAAIVQREYPMAYEQYMALGDQNGLELGTVQFVDVSGDGTKFVANCMTQDDFGTHKRQVNYEAVYTCFEELRDFAIDNNISNVALPCIGAGLAGGSWSVIESMLCDVFRKGCGVRATYHTID